MDKLASFQRDHNTMEAGLYLQQVIHGIAIYDLRFVKPNTIFIPIEAMHTIEHLAATWLKVYSDIKDYFISFNPAACQTMFYLEILNDKNIDVKNEIIKFIEWAIQQTSVVGATPQECGNYTSHNLERAKAWLTIYKEVLNGSRKTNKCN